MISRELISKKLLVPVVVGLEGAGLAETHVFCLLVTQLG